MTHSISDHGDFDFLTPPEPSDTDKAIARAAREAIEAHRAWRNDEDAKRLQSANVLPFRGDRHG